MPAAQHVSPLKNARALSGTHAPARPPHKSSCYTSHHCLLISSSSGGEPAAIPLSTLAQAGLEQKKTGPPPNDHSSFHLYATLRAQTLLQPAVQKPTACQSSEITRYFPLRSSVFQTRLCCIDQGGTCRTCRIQSGTFSLLCVAPNKKNIKAKIG